jgi:hypothetical protein
MTIKSKNTISKAAVILVGYLGISIGYAVVALLEYSSSA